MLPKFKMYVFLVFSLITAQIALAGETVVDFQRALKAYEKEREPSQTKDKNSKKIVENPEIEVNLKEEKEASEEK